MERSHRKLVAVSLVGSEHPTKVVERVERVLVVETFLVFAVAAFHLSVVARGIGTDQFVPDTQLLSGFFKQGRFVLCRRKTIGEFKAVVGLNAFYLNASAGEFGYDL